MNSVTPPLFERLEAVLRDAAGIVTQMRASAQADEASGLSSEPEYLSVKQLANRIPYKEHTIRNLISVGEFREGVHYYKRRGRVMFSWPAMRRWVEEQSVGRLQGIPLVRNRYGHSQ